MKPATVFVRGVQAVAPRNLLDISLVCRSYKATIRADAKLSITEQN